MTHEAPELVLVKLIQRLEAVRKDLGLDCDSGVRTRPRSATVRPYPCSRRQMAFKASQTLGVCIEDLKAILFRPDFPLELSSSSTEHVPSSEARGVNAGSTWHVNPGSSWAGDFGGNTTT
jgi:hypothetical protein